MSLNQEYHFTIVWNDEQDAAHQSGRRVASDTMGNKQDAIDAACSIIRTLKKSHKAIAYGFIVSEKQMVNSWVIDQKLTIAQGNVGRVSCFVAPEVEWSKQHVDVILGI